MAIASRRSSAERLCDEGMWIIEYIQHWEGRDDHPDGSAASLVMRFKTEIMSQFAQYQLPVIGLAAETPPEAVCTVFEKVNTGGVTLTTFELVTAMFAGHGFKLREDWESRRRHLHDQFDVLKGIGGEHFLQTVTLLMTQAAKRQAQGAGVPPERVPGVKCKKHDVLRLAVSEYEEWADLVQIGYEEAAKFLHRQFVFTHNNIPYGTQLVPLAALYVDLSAGELHSASARERLEQWYWCGVLGERYSTGTETQYAIDLEEVAAFVRTGEPPRIVREASFNPERLISMTTRNSAAYKGMFALQMKQGGRDWMTGEALTQMALENENVDVHHVFPINYCEKREEPIPYWLYQSVVNKAPIDARTNRSLGGRAPSIYLPNLEERAGECLGAILDSYGIDIRTLERDQFAKFFVRRGQKMLRWIADAMGKSRELILGSSLSEFMGKLGMDSVGGARTRLRNQMRRLFNAHVQLVYEDKLGEASVSSSVTSRTEFWWDPKQPDVPMLWDSKIELSWDFFNEIIRRPVPLDMNTLTALKRCSLGLDLYLWLAYRTFALKRPLQLSWRQLYRQFGADPDKGMCCNFQKAARERLVESTGLRLMQPPRTAC